MYRHFSSFLFFIAKSAFAFSLFFPSFSSASPSCAETLESPTALERLREYVIQQGGPRKRPMGDPRHFLGDYESQVSLSIGFLRRNQKQFMKNALEAIREGQISQVHAGFIVGPKVPALIMRMIPIGNAQSEGIDITGLIRAPDLLKEMAKEVGESATKSPNDPTRWTEQDVAEFYAALRDLKLEEACQRYYGTGLDSCRNVYFRFNTKHLDQISWNTYPH